MATSARPGSTAIMRKPAVWLKPFALMARRVQDGAQGAGLFMSDPANGGHGARNVFGCPTISAWWVGEAQACLPSRWNAHRQGFDASHEAGIHPLRLAHHLDPVEALQDLLPY